MTDETMVRAWARDEVKKWDSAAAKEVHDAREFATAQKTAIDALRGEHVALAETHRSLVSDFYKLKEEVKAMKSPTLTSEAQVVTTLIRTAGLIVGLIISGVTWVNLQRGPETSLADAQTGCAASCAPFGVERMNFTHIGDAQRLEQCVCRTQFPMGWEGTAMSRPIALPINPYIRLNALDAGTLDAGTATP